MGEYFFQWHISVSQFVMSSCFQDACSLSPQSARNVVLKCLCNRRFHFPSTFNLVPVCFSLKSVCWCDFKKSQETPHSIFLADNMFSNITPTQFSNIIPTKKGSKESSEALRTLRNAYWIESLMKLFPKTVKSSVWITYKTCWPLFRFWMFVFLHV